MIQIRCFVRTVLSKTCFTIAVISLVGCQSILVKSTPITTEQTTKDFRQYYVLPKALVEFEIVPDADFDEKACEAKGKNFFKKTVTLIPDLEHRYLLTLLTNPAFADVIKVSTDPAGILTKVTTTTTDESVSITNKLLALATEIEKLSNTPTNTQFSRAPGAGVAATPNCESFAGYLILGEGGGVIEIENYSVTISKVAPSASTSASKSALNTCRADSICYRPLSPYIVEVKRKALSPSAKLIPRLSTLLLLPDTETILSLQIERAPFVLQKADFTFKDGMLNDSDINRPSSFAGFVDIPINLAKAIVSIPAALLDFKITNTKKETTLADEQLKLLKKQQDLLDELVKKQKEH